MSDNTRNTASARTRMVIAVGVFVIVAVMAMFVLAIWTGDHRWGYTGGVFLVPAGIAAAAVIAAFMDGDL